MVPKVCTKFAGNLQIGIHVGKLRISNTYCWVVQNYCDQYMDLKLNRECGAILSNPRLSP